MDYIDRKTFEIMNIRIKSILSFAKRIDDNKTLRGISDEIEIILNSVESGSNGTVEAFNKNEKEDNTIKEKIIVNRFNKPVLEEVNPTRVVKPIG